MAAVDPAWMHWLGGDGGSIYDYLSNIGLLGILISSVTHTIHALRARTCHVKRCWWIGHHEYRMNGVTYRLCRRHHPAADAETISHEDVVAHWNGQPV